MQGEAKKTGELKTSVDLDIAWLKQNQTNTSKTKKDTIQENFI